MRSIVPSIKVGTHTLAPQSLTRTSYQRFLCFLGRGAGLLSLRFGLLIVLTVFADVTVVVSSVLFAPSPLRLARGGLAGG